MRLFLRSMASFSSLSAYQCAQAFRQTATLIVGIVLVKAGISLPNIGEVELYFYAGGMLTFWWASPLLQHAMYEKPSQLSAMAEQLRWMLLCLSMTSLGIYHWIQKDGHDTLIADYLPQFWAYALFLIGQILLHLRINIWFRMQKITIIIGVSSVFYALYILCFALVFWTHSIEYTLYGLAGLGGIWLIFETILTCKERQFVGPQILQWLDILKSAWPLFLYALLGQLPLYIDPWLVQHLEKSKEVFAIYRFGARELPIIVPLLISFGQAHVSIINEGEQGLYRLKKSSKKYVLGVGALVITLILTSRQIYIFLYSDAFISSVLLFDLMLLVLFSKLLFPQSILLAYRETRILNRIAVYELLINLAFSIGLYFCFGIVGIVMATVLAYLFERIGQMFLLKKKYNIPPTHYTHVVIWWIFFIAALTTIAIKWWILFPLP